MTRCQGLQSLQSIFHFKLRKGDRKALVFVLFSFVSIKDTAQQKGNPKKYLT